MTRYLLKAAAALVAVAFVANSAYAQQSANTTGDANAELVRELSVAQDVALNFGQISLPASNAAGVVTISPAGAASGDFTPVGSVAAGAFTIDGPDGAVASITLPTGSITLNGPAGATMPVDTFASSDPSVTLTSGTGTFTVGGTLNVGPSQEVGSYTGTYNVQVDIP